MSHTALYSTVKLTRSWWDAPEPVKGDVLKTSTGRMYEIHEVNGKTLRCMVIPSDARLTEGARIFDWQWNRR